MAACGFNMKNLMETEKYEVKSYVLDDDFDDIVINVDSDSFAIYKSEDEKTHVEVFESEKMKYDVSVNNKVLNIESQQLEDGFDFSKMHFVVDFRQEPCKVFLPKEEYESLRTKIESGSFTSGQPFTFHDAQIELGSGSLRIDSMKAEELTGTSKSGKKKYYYACSLRRKEKTCTKKMVRKDWIENLVVDFILDYVLSDDQIEKTAEAVLKLQAQEAIVSPLGAMEAEYSEIMKQIDNINNAIAAGIWNASTSQKLKTLEDSAETLRFSIDSLKYSQAQLLDHDRVIFFLRRFTKGDRNDPLLRRHIVETFVNAVYLYDDHVDIITNNVENNERFKLDAIPDECSDVDMLGVPNVSHPNTRVTVYRIAV
jgi:hypothetical protein